MKKAYKFIMIGEGRPNRCTETGVKETHGSSIILLEVSTTLCKTDISINLKWIGMIRFVLTS